MSLGELDVDGLSAEELAALERFEQWCAAHPDRSGGISLMSVEFQDAMQWWVDEFCPDALFLFGDGDASNCAAVYRYGPLRGTVLILMHDDEDLTPRFASLQALVDVLVTDVSDVRDFGMLSYAEPSLGSVPAELFDDLYAALLASDDDALWRYGPRVLASVDYQGLGAELQDVLDERALEDDHADANARLLEILRSGSRP